MASAPLLDFLAAQRVEPPVQNRNRNLPLPSTKCSRFAAVHPWNSGVGLDQLDQSIERGDNLLDQLDQAETMVFKLLEAGDYHGEYASQSL